MRTKIRLETFSDARQLVAAATQVPIPVYITDGAGLKVSAKSLMGALYSIEFNELWCECDMDIYHIIKDFVAD